MSLICIYIIFSKSTYYFANITFYLVTLVFLFFFLVVMWQYSQIFLFFALKFKTMENNIFDFFKEINVSITVSDTDGNVVYMNDKSKCVFSDMVGKNMMSCHKQSSQETIKRLIAEKQTNVYTIQKGDVRKMIYQTPWYVEGEIKGLIEYSIVLPDEMPHYQR